MSRIWVANRPSFMKSVTMAWVAVGTPLSQEALTSAKVSTSPRGTRMKPSRREGNSDFEKVPTRSEERRVGKECVRTGSYRWAPDPQKKNHTQHRNQRKTNQLNQLPLYIEK